MAYVRLKSLKDCMQTARKLVHFQLLVHALCPDLAYQASNPPDVIDHVPLFPVRGDILLTYW